MRLFAIAPGAQRTKPAKTTRAILVDIQDNTTFQETLDILNNTFNVTDGKCFRVKKQFNEDVYSFDGKPFVDFMRQSG